MSASTYTMQATVTMSASSDPARGIDPATAKPSDRFLIGVLIALFVILGICMVLLMKRVVSTNIRRLRRQRSAVNVIIQRKIRRRRPRLFDVRIEDAREHWRQSHYDTMDMYGIWGDLQPLAMAVEYPVEQSTIEGICAAQTLHARNTHAVESSSFQSASTSPQCKMEIDNTRTDEPLPSPDESNQSRPSLEPIDATARICVLISLPCPTRSTRYRIPTPFSSSGHPSELRTSDSHLVAPRSSQVETAPVPTLPSCLALGVAPSPLTVYQ